MKRTPFLTSLIILIVCASLETASPADQPIASVLTDRYHDQTLYLRHALTSSSQKYDADGQPLGGEEGTWTLYGRISVKRISIDSGALRVEGNRVIYRFSDREKRFMAFPNGESVKIEIHLSSPLTSEDQATAVLGRVFALTQEDILQTAPQYWRAYLGGSASRPPQDTGTSQKQPPANPQALEGAGAGNGKVFRVGEGGVTAPKAIYNPEPEFTEVARRAQFQGTVGLFLVIDSKGQVGGVSISMPLGMGLDESAVEKVKQWRFTPAMKDGTPVAVQVYVEVSYYLGRNR